MTSTVGSSPKRVLISIHDVTPALDERVRALWAMCRTRDVTPALFVVPNWHGTWPLEESLGFVDWVRGCASSGAELFLHGERHDEVGSPRGWRDSWRAWGKTEREGEFLTLDETAARERIDRGLAVFERLGLKPIGFVAPAWLAGRECTRAVASAGLQYSETERAILVLRNGATQIPSPVVRWSSRTPVRAVGSAVVAEARWRTQRGQRYVRLAFHPTDLDRAMTARSAAASLDRWLANRDVSRYAEL